MNFKLKALAVAAALTLSGAANALTNNEMFLVAFDATNSKTFVAALGGAGTAASFNGSSNLNIDYSADANWTNFITGASANVSYQVLGFNMLGTSGAYNAGDKLLVTTNSMPAGNILSNLTYGNLSSDVTLGTGGVNKFEALNSAITGSTTGLILGGGADSGLAVGTSVFGKVINIADTTAALGTNLNFYSITRPASTSNVAQGIVQQYTQDAGLLALRGATGVTGDFWNLSASGLLTYTGAATVAAVPETNTWAMALLGLGFMGFVARRRA
jgi:hypothetical protein